MMSRFLRATWPYFLYLLILIAILGLTLYFWVLPEWNKLLADPGLLEKDRIDEQTKLIQTVAQIVGGAAILVGLVFTGRQAVAANKNILIAQETQRTDRFTKAIEQLKDSDASVSLAGVFALERIAREYPETFHWAIMDILTTYVREKRPVSGIEPNARYTPPLQQVQACLTAIGRRDVQWEEKEREWHERRGEVCPRPDLSRTNLNGANLVRGRLSDLNLTESHFEEADLQRARCERSWLGKCDLQGAKLQHADFTQARLTSAILSNAQMTGAKLRGALLQGANLQSAQGISQYTFDSAVPGIDHDTGQITRAPSSIAGQVNSISRAVIEEGFRHWIAYAPNQSWAMPLMRATFDDGVAWVDGQGASAIEGANDVMRFIWDWRNECHTIVGELKAKHAAPASATVEIHWYHGSGGYRSYWVLRRLWRQTVQYEIELRDERISRVVASKSSLELKRKLHQ